MEEGGELSEEVALEEDEEEEEARRAKSVTDPRVPSKTEVDEHNLTHLPFRSWCPWCIQGKARNVFHKRQGGEHHDVPHMVVDYCFLGDKEDEETLVVQVARDLDSKFLFSHAVPRKGLAHVHGAEELIKDIDDLGYGKMILKTDNEPAMKTLQEEVRSRREAQTILENSPIGESQSNGIAERAVQALSEQVRTLRVALSNRTGVLLSAKHPVTAWLVEHAGELISRFHVGKDGKTAYERAKGKTFKKGVRIWRSSVV